VLKKSSTDEIEWLGFEEKAHGGGPWAPGLITSHSGLNGRCAAPHCLAADARDD